MSPAIPGTTIHVLPGGRRPVIINSPSLIEAPVRLGLGLVTAGFWTAWLFFWRPVALVFSKMTGIPNPADLLVFGDGLRSFLQVLPWYLLVVLLMGTVLIGWANLNWVRFSNKERRSARPPVTPEAMAGHFGVTVEELAVHSRRNRIEISYDGTGKIRSIGSSVQELEIKYQ
jgi:biofilm PGA synthesis protein PgaD